MKNIALFIILLAFILINISCDEVENLADVDFSTVLTKTIPVAVITTNEMTTSLVLDATTDPEIAKYAGKIKKYEITELLFEIKNYNAPNDDEIYFDGEIGFSNKNQSQASSTCAINPLPVTHWAGTGTFEIGTCNDILDGISQMLTTDNAVKIYMNGTFTQQPLSFDLVVTAKVKITANPL